MNHPPRVQIKRAGVIGKQAIRKKYLSRREVEFVDESWLHEILEGIASNHIFCHVGLSDVNSAFPGNPYHFLKDILHEYFDSIIAPAFTASFLDSRVFCPNHTKSDSGTFANLLIEDGVYRTPDAMRSIVVDGPYRFDDCMHRDSYDDNSAFAKLERDNVPVLNIGTPWLKCSQWHYLEQEYDVPYMETRSIEGVIIRKNGSVESITQRTGLFTETWVHNRPKITRKLQRDGILHQYQKNGLNVMWHHLGDMRESLHPKLIKNGYYLVT